MKLKVKFREYDKPYVDEETGGEEERGEFLGSFSKVIEGGTFAEILEKATEMAEQLSKEYDSDVRVWEIPISPQKP